MKSIIISLFIVLMAVTAYAANSVISFTDMLINTPYATGPQTETINPALTILIGDNNSHTLVLNSIQSNPPIIYVSLRFNGTGSNCIVRLMGNSTKASWVAYPVAAGTVFAQGVNTGFKQFQYSSCYN
jgi:hypothetical protein